MDEEKRDWILRELYKVNWIKLLKRSIERRPSSWGYPTDPARPSKNHYPISEWRNASDELCMEVVKALEEILIDVGDENE